MKCRDCGAENPDHVTYCGLCFSRLNGSDQDPPAGDNDLSDGEKADIEVSLNTGPVKRKRRVGTWVLASTVIVATVVVAVMVLLGQCESKPEETVSFSSGESLISFDYPESWEERGQEYLEQLFRGSLPDEEYGNEAVLMKRGGAIFRHLLVVTSRERGYEEDEWSDIESMLKRSYRESAAMQGVKVDFFSLKAPLEEEAEGFGAMFTTDLPLGPDMFQLEALILDGNTEYRVQLITPLKGGGSNEGDARVCFDDIIDTVTLSRPTVRSR
jgi:hypothetical protein